MLLFRLLVDPVIENEHGTFIMSSKDLCMLRHVPELIRAGVESFKIEGRMKSAYYTAVVPSEGISLF